MVYNGLNGLSFALLPATCVLCGSRGMPGIDLCKGCCDDLARFQYACQRCGQPMIREHHELQSRLCGRCLQHPPNFDYLVAAYHYTAPMDWLIQGMKFNSRLALLRVLTKLFIDFMQSQILDLPELIIPVPLHKSRLQQRGFNQALELARPLSKQLSIPLRTKLCVRDKNTLSQSELTAKQRVENMRNAFSLRDKLTAKSIAIVDDVVTTGATVNALSRLLKRNGAEQVQVWALAKTSSQ